MKNKNNRKLGLKGALIGTALLGLSATQAQGMEMKNLFSIQSNFANLQSLSFANGTGEDIYGFNIKIPESVSDTLFDFSYDNTRYKEVSEENDGMLSFNLLDENKPITNGQEVGVFFIYPTNLTVADYLTDRATFEAYNSSGSVFAKGSVPFLGLYDTPWENNYQNGVNPVPEPATGLLLGLGAAGIAAISRKRKKGLDNRL